METVSLSRVLRKHPLSTVDVPDLSEIALQFLRNTCFEGQLQINSPVLPGQIGIFFCRFGSGVFANFTGNCRYVRDDSERHLILCDIDFLLSPDNALSDASDITGFGEDDSIFKISGFTDQAVRFETMFRRFARQSVTHFFPRWVIGHEIGHAVLGHGKSAIRRNDHDEIEIMREARSNEIEADIFAIERLITSEKEKLNCFHAINYLINHWIRIETGAYSVELGSANYRGPIIEIRDGSLTHPHMIARLLNLIDALLRKSPDIDTTGYYSRLQSQLRIV